MQLHSPILEVVGALLLGGLGLPIREELVRAALLVAAGAARMPLARLLACDAAAALARSSAPLTASSSSSRR